MKRYKHILFDLDGTLSDPKEGIVKSVQFALSKFNLTEEDDNVLNAFIGPPLVSSFKDFYGFSDEQALLAVRYFREYFKEQGIYQNLLYEGVEAMLESLCRSRLTLYIATSKLEIFAVQIIGYFKLNSYFKDVTGCFADGSRVEKAEIIDYIIKKHQLNRIDCLMIGDRKHDIIGARENHIDCGAVLYGFGTKDEITKYQPDYIFGQIDDIAKLLCPDPDVNNTF